MEKNDVRITTNIPYELTDPDLTGKLSSLETVGPIVSVSKVGDSFNFPNAESVVGQFGYETGLTTGTNIDTTGFANAYKLNNLGFAETGVSYDGNKFTGKLEQSLSPISITNGIMARPYANVTKTEGSNVKTNFGVDVNTSFGDINIGKDGLKFTKSFKKGGLLDKNRG